MIYELPNSRVAKKRLKTYDPVTLGNLWKGSRSGGNRA